MKILGIISIVLTWTAIATILLRAPKELSRSISHHAAINKRYYLFAILMTLSLLAMYVFMIWWFVPEFLLSSLFATLMTVIIVLELVTTWVPLTDGWKYTFHQGCSYGAALLIPIALFGMLSSPIISATAHGVTVLAIATIAFLLFLFLFVKSTRKHYLLYQSLYVVVFHMALLATVYIV